MPQLAHCRAAWQGHCFHRTKQVAPTGQRIQNGTQIATIKNAMTIASMMANRLLANRPKPVFGLDGLLGSFIRCFQRYLVDPARVHPAQLRTGDTTLRAKDAGRHGQCSYGPTGSGCTTRSDSGSCGISGSRSGEKGGWAGSSPSPGVRGSCTGSGSSTGSVSSPGRNGVVAMKMVLFMLLPSIETLS